MGRMTVDQLELPNGVDELEEWLDRSGGRTGRIMGVRRAQWEDWSIVHRLAVCACSPFGGGLKHLTRKSDGVFEIREKPSAPAQAALTSSMLFFDSRDEPEDVAERVFAVADAALRLSSAVRLRRWLAIDLALEDAELDAEACRAAIAEDPRISELAWFEYCAVFCGTGAPSQIVGGALRPETNLH